MYYVDDDSSDSHNSCDRKSDKICNDFGHVLLDMCSNFDLSILNGLNLFDGSYAYNRGVV